MKALLLSFVFVSSAAYAVTDTTVSGHGYSSMYCQHDFAQSCVSNIKQMALNDAINQARISCESQRGQLDDYTANCSEFCNPTVIPPNVSAEVTCTTDCTVRCEINE